MSETSSINTLIGTFSSIDALNSRTILSNSVVCIDTNNNRIGINTIEPSYSITIVDNGSVNNGIYTPRLYFDLTKLPNSETGDGLTQGQVYRNSTGFLKVKVTQ